MTTQLNADLKIPDLWFDFYARFLPGTIFVAALYILWPGDLSIPSGWLAAILALGAFIVGLLIQPLSSELTGILHSVMAWMVTGERYYVRKRGRLDPLRILSKMHGETTFFVQCFFLSAIMLTLQKIPSFHLESTGNTVTANVLFLPFALVMAVDVSWRRVRRAQLLNEDARRETATHPESGQQADAGDADNPRA